MPPASSGLLPWEKRVHRALRTCQQPWAERTRSHPLSPALTHSHSRFQSLWRSRRVFALLGQGHNYRVFSLAVRSSQGETCPGQTSKAGGHEGSRVAHWKIIVILCARFGSEVLGLSEWIIVTYSSVIVCLSHKDMRSQNDMPHKTSMSR